MYSPLYFLQALKINHSLHVYTLGNSKSEPEESHTHNLGNEFQIVANQGQRFFSRGAGRGFEFIYSRKDLQQHLLRVAK